jgi:hypothetical protein
MNLTNCPVCRQEINEDKELGKYVFGIYGDEHLVCGNCVPLHFCEDCEQFVWNVIEKNPCEKRLCGGCEEYRLDEIAEEDRLTVLKEEQEKTDKKEKLNEAIVARWELLKEEMEGWINEVVNEDKRFTDDIVRREGLIKSLNIMLDETGLSMCDDYSE